MKQASALIEALGLRPRTRIYTVSSSECESECEGDRSQDTTYKPRCSLRLIHSRSEITTSNNSKSIAARLHLRKQRELQKRPERTDPNQSKQVLSKRKRCAGEVINTKGMNRSKAAQEHLEKQREEAKRSKMSPEEIVKKGEDPTKQSQISATTSSKETGMVKKPNPPKQKEIQAPVNETEEDDLLPYRKTILKIFLEFIKKCMKICINWGKIPAIEDHLIMLAISTFFDREIRPKLKKEARNDEDYTKGAREFISTAMYLSLKFRFYCKTCDNKPAGQYCFCSLLTSFQDMMNNALKGDSKFLAMASLEFSKTFPEIEKKGSTKPPKDCKQVEKENAPKPTKEVEENSPIIVKEVEIPKPANPIPVEKQNPPTPKPAEKPKDNSSKPALPAKIPLKKFAGPIREIPLIETFTIQKSGSGMLIYPPQTLQKGIPPPQGLKYVKVGSSPSYYTICKSTSNICKPKNS